MTDPQGPANPIPPPDPAPAPVVVPLYEQTTISVRRSWSNALLTSVLLLGGTVLAAIIVVGVLVAVGASSGSSPGTTEPKASAMSADSGGSPTDNSVGGSLQGPAPVGTRVSLANLWRVTVVSARLDADVVLATTDTPTRPEAGMRFVLVKVTVANAASKPAGVSSSVKLSLVSTSGHASRQILVAHVPGELDTGATLSSGDSLTGELVFQVSPADVDASVLVAEPLVQVDPNGTQRFLALN